MYKNKNNLRAICYMSLQQQLSTLIGPRAKVIWRTDRTESSFKGPFMTKYLFSFCHSCVVNFHLVSLRVGIHRLALVDLLMQAHIVRSRNNIWNCYLCFWGRFGYYITNFADVLDDLLCTWMDYVVGADVQDYFVWWGWKSGHNVVLHIARFRSRERFDGDRSWAGHLGAD